MDSIQTTNSTTPLQRESGIELFRIIAMLLVVMVHTGFASLNKPSQSEVLNETFVSSFRYLVELMSIVCVDCFVIITGWFGTKFKIKSLLSLLFQALFFSYLIYFIAVATGEVAFNIDTFVAQAKVFNIYWFLGSFMLLIVLSPILNSYVASASKKDFRTLLITFYIFNLVIGWISTKDSIGFHFGYSTLGFILIYMTARYLRLYCHEITNKPKFAYLSIYFGIVLLGLLISIGSAFALSTKDYYYTTNLLLFYNSPTTIIAAFGLFLFFSRLKFSNRIVNWAAASAFSIYLLHCNTLIFQNFKDMINSHFYSMTLLQFILSTLGIIAIIFIVAITLDQLRILAWQSLLKLYEKTVNNRHRQKDVN